MEIFWHMFFYLIRHNLGVVISNSCVWMNSICTASSSIRTRSNCSTCLFPQCINNMLMFTPALTLRTSATTSMNTSARESWTNSISQCSAKSVQSVKAQSVIQGNIQHYTPKGKDLAHPDKLVTKWYFIHVTASEMPGNRRQDLRLRRRRTSVSFSSCLLWITGRGHFRHCTRQYGYTSLPIVMLRC